MKIEDVFQNINPEDNYEPGMKLRTPKSRKKKPEKKMITLRIEDKLLDLVDMRIKSLNMSKTEYIKILIREDLGLKEDF